MKVHLVDGQFELFRCFHGAPRAQDAEGREVGAAIGLMHTFIALLRKPDVTHLAIAFDSIVDSGRGSGNDDGSRLRSQFPLAAEVTRALGILMWPMSRFQADDALATAAARFRPTKNNPVSQVLICSPDNDFTQCVVGEEVVMLDRVRKRVIDEAAVVNRFGITPNLIPAYLALVGDVSDGLPGIPGWGAKSTAQILNAYPEIEAIPENPSDWSVPIRGAERLARSLNERRREAYLYRNLSILRTDVPLPDELHHLEWTGARRIPLEALARRFGEEAVLERVPHWIDGE